MNVTGSKVTVIAGARLRKISQDGKHLEDQKLHEGALVERDSTAKILHVVDSKDPEKPPLTAYVVELDYEGKKLVGWVYNRECTGYQPR